MSNTLRRGSASRRSNTPARRGARQPSLIDRALLMLPISEAMLKRIATGGVLTLVLGGALGLSTLFGVPQAAGTAVAEGIGEAGLRVEGIDVTGARHIDPMLVYATVLDQKSRALPLVDLGEVRAKLLRFGWIADAQVSRRLPDKLVIHIIEREPAAAWQKDGQLMLIDASGVPLERVDASRIASLPLLIGDGANFRAMDYRRLIDAAPALRGRVKAATWVGNRRWDLLFDSGETLSLPEDGADKALVKFASTERLEHLLGRGWLRFDMRVPDRFVGRKPSPGNARAISDGAPVEAPNSIDGGEG